MNLLSNNSIYLSHESLVILGRSRNQIVKRHRPDPRLAIYKTHVTRVRKGLI
jgi:hypothetical protein